jgi:glycosyltransferase involved in cell wall biosynthesis
VKDACRPRRGRLGIGGAHHLARRQPQETVLEEYRGADLFILNSRIAEDGDRDGLPNVLMEAQSQRLAVIATNLAGIPELVIDGETGTLVLADDAQLWRRRSNGCCGNQICGGRLAAAGYQRVRTMFAMDRGIADLERRFQQP